MRINTNVKDSTSTILKLYNKTNIKENGSAVCSFGSSAYFFFFFRNLHNNAHTSTIDRISKRKKMFLNNYFKGKKAVERYLFSVTTKSLVDEIIIFLQLL